MMDVLLLVLGILFSAPIAISCPTDCQSYESCNEVKEGALNVHLIAHSHDDAGWLKTVDQYYYGSNKGEAAFGVRHIIDSVINELEQDKTRKFIYAEVTFLWRWWMDQDELNRERLRKLVREGRFQMIHGGWVMSDEAVTHYSALITQMDIGLRFIEKELGSCARPTIAWQIDSFGHSSEVGLQFSQMAYQGLFVGRIDTPELFDRRSTKKMEMIWRLKSAPGEYKELFTGVLYNLYQPPDGFCFDAFCNDNPIMNNPHLHGNNIDEVDVFVYYAKVWAQAYQTNHVMLTMGGDFNYMVAGTWFNSMDKLIEYGNAKHTGINILYSTPACYLKAINSVNTTWPTRDNDFFPYSSYDGRYWSGYYSSRPALKYMAYRANNLLQVAKILGTFLGEQATNNLWAMERAIGLVQHHDAISGTAKQHVTNDYAVYLHELFDAGQSVLTSAYRFLFGISYPKQEFCLLANISMCEISEHSERFVVNVFNPLSRSVTVPVRLPVPVGEFTVTDNTGEITSELFILPKSMWVMPGRQSTTKHELAFIANDIPAMGLKTFFIEKQEYNQSDSSTKFAYPSPIKKNELVIVENGENMKLVMNGSTGKLMKIILNNKEWILEQDFLSYKSNFMRRSLPAGAYTFNPTYSPILIAQNASFTVVKGKFMTEIHQTFNSWVSQVIRVYEGSDKIEFNWMVGPIEIMGLLSSEVITRYRTNLRTNGLFYTDSNGRRFIERRRNLMPSTDPNGAYNVASNYFPVTSTAFIKDSEARLSVLIDRPHGASSLEDGCLELMLHRRLMTDDAKGVQEPLNEEAFGVGLVVRGTHTVFLDTRSTKMPYSKQHRRIDATQIVFGPWMSLSPFKGSINDYTYLYPLEVKPVLNFQLDKNINILTLEYKDFDHILLRVEHLLEANNESQNVLPVKISIKKLFKKLTIVKIEERTLDGNKDIECVQPLKWNHLGNDTRRNQITEPVDEDLQSFVIDPMEIRTFLLTVKHNQ